MVERTSIGEIHSNIVIAHCFTLPIVLGTVGYKKHKIQAVLGHDTNSSYT